MIKNKTPKPRLSESIKLYIKKHKILTTFFIIVVMIFLLIGILNSFVFKPAANTRFGVSFAKQRSVELGLDWRANYLALLDDLQLKHLRLVSYWSTGEPTRGNYDFSDLDWQMDQAAARGVKVSLATGLRQPRWPECHQPDWSLELTGNAWKQSLYSYMEVVTNRYKNHPALESWQLENEAANNWFGKCEKPDMQRTKEEFSLLKKWDPNHKVIMSLSDQHGLPFNGPMPDEFGFSVYRIVYNTFGPHFYIYYPTPIWYHRLRAVVITWMQQRPIMIHELQMEPWGPKDTSQISIAEQDKSMSIKQIPKSFDFAKKIGAKDIDLWGGEWWYWRKTKLNDSSVWDTVKSELQKSN